MAGGMGTTSRHSGIAASPITSDFMTIDHERSG